MQHDAQKAIAEVIIKCIQKIGKGRNNSTTTKDI